MSPGMNSQAPPAGRVVTRAEETAIAMSPAAARSDSSAEPGRCCLKASREDNTDAVASRTRISANHAGKMRIARNAPSSPLSNAAMTSNAMPLQKYARNARLDPMKCRNPLLVRSSRWTDGKLITFTVGHNAVLSGRAAARKCWSEIDSSARSA